MSDSTIDNLAGIVREYFHPDPEVISQREVNGHRLSYVGHAHITRILLDIDPLWSWEPLEIRDGRPVTHLHNGQIHRRDRDSIDVPTVSLWGRLTIHGVSRIAVGSVDAHKPDLDKELVSNLIVNGAMRFGIALALWTGDDAPVVTQMPSRASQTAPEPRKEHPATSRVLPSESQAFVVESEPASDAQERMIFAISKKLGLLPPARGSLTRSAATKRIDQLKELEATRASQENEEDVF
jgi:hypothetical protein